MKLLITGAAGMLGGALVRKAAAGHEAVGVDLPDADLTDPEQAAGLIRRHRPDRVIHAAAFTDVDGAEDRRADCFAVNAEATGHLAAACAEAGCGLTYVSTDYVFPGTSPDGYDEDDPRDPVNHYGATKAAGEDHVTALGPAGQVVRTSWLFGAGPRNFVLTVRRLLDERGEMRVVDDQVGRPTYAEDLAGVLLYLAEEGSGGVYHATNSGSCSWYVFAREVARIGGRDPELVRPCATADFPTPARRPACSILRSSRLEAVGCPDRPPWQDALGRYISWLDARGE